MLDIPVYTIAAVIDLEKGLAICATSCCVNISMGERQEGYLLALVMRDKLFFQLACPLNQRY